MIRRSPLRRRTWMRKRAPRRLQRRAADRPYLAFVRQLPCVWCGRRGPSDAAHMPVGARGMGFKAPDRNVVPLCRPCHRKFDGHDGIPLSRDERRALAVKMLADVELATTPGENKDEALALEAAGLGRIEELPGGGWAWRTP